MKPATAIGSSVLDALDVLRQGGLMRVAFAVEPGLGVESEPVGGAR